MMVGRGSLEGAATVRRTLGIHLMPVAASVASPRPSIVAELDEACRLVDLRPFQHIAEIAQSLPAGPVLVAVDAPTVVPNERGQRDVDALLACVDVPVFPVSRSRLTKVSGAIRGEELRVAIDAAAGQVSVVEAVPDVVLRLLAWREHPASDTDDLAVFRATWLGMRPQPYRPKGTGRAKPAGIAAAFALLARHVDLAGWLPAASGDDWDDIRDAATLDAIACAYSAWCVEHGDAAIVTGAAGAVLALPTDAMLTARLEVNAARLRGEGRAEITVRSGARV